MHKNPQNSVFQKCFSLPSWTKKVYPGDEMEKLANFCFSMPTNNKLLARLKTGFFVRDIVERFTMKSQSKLSPDRSLWIYSAHDATIASVLNALGLFKVMRSFLNSKFCLTEPLFFYCHNYSRCTFHHTSRVYFSSFTSPTGNIMSKYSTNAIAVKTKRHLNHFPFQIAVKNVH